MPRHRIVRLALATALALTPAGTAQAATRISHHTLPTRTLSGHSYLRTSTATPISWILTTGDQTQLLAQQPAVSFGADLPSYYSWSRIDVSDATTYQKVQGVGAAMTESSAVNLDSLPATTKSQVLRSLFDPATGAGLSVLRTPLGASDFALSDYTFDDQPWGTTDPSLAHFSIARDQTHLLPLVSAAHGINPGLTVLATPWSAPAWMKTNVNTHDGQLAAGYEDAYARYLAKAIAAYRAAGAPVSAVTVTNEPESPKGYSPSMTMTEAQQAEFVGVHLRPVLDAAHLADVAILGYDGNWDDPAYPVGEVTGPYAASFAGAAFHCYAGDESAQAQIPAGKQVWTSECSGGDWSPDFAQNLRWNAHHLLIGAFRNNSRAVLLFNLALDPADGPTNGGCTNCRGLLTIDPATHAMRYNVEYYLLAHVGRYVHPGAVRIASTASNPTGVQSVAFRNPDGSHALLLYNEGGSSQPVTVRWKNLAAQVHLPSGAVATLHW